MVLELAVGEIQLQDKPVVDVAVFVPEGVRLVFQDTPVVPLQCIYIGCGDDTVRDGIKLLAFNEIDGKHWHVWKLPDLMEYL